MQRLHEQFVHEPTYEPSSHWQMVRARVLRDTNLEPFSQVDRLNEPFFRYLPSHKRSRRFEILDGEAPYSVSTDWEPDVVARLPPGVGPVEIDLAGFLMDRRTDLGVLIGGMGSGKSTSLRQVAAWLRDEVRVCYINFDRVTLDLTHPPSAAEILVNALSPLLSQLVPSNVELGECWNWAIAQYLSEDPDRIHPVMRVIVQGLQAEHDDDWSRDDAQTRVTRRRLRTELKDMNALLGYLAMRLDYHLTVACGNQRHRLCIVLDNADPLPPQLQRDLLTATAPLQLSANCKVLIAMRPLTYSLTHGQRANRTVKVMQHLGPPALDLIEDRVKRLIEDRDCPDLRLSIRLPNGDERVLEQEDVKAWARQILSDIRHASSSRGNRHAGPNASEFLEGLCNNSLRSALLVAEKIFGSPTLPMVIPPEQQGPDGAPGALLKSHSIIRAILLARHSHFESDVNRVTDNLFDLGDATHCVSPTCKFRMLKELERAPGRGILPLEELLRRMRRFGYDDHTLLVALNGIIDQVKRMAWSDQVAVYKSLDSPPHSRICISRSGRFYVAHATQSLEYVQEVHVDVLLPGELVIARYNHRSFTERIRSVYRFVRYLHDVDRREVLAALTDPECRTLYVRTYGRGLFTTAMADALASQVVRITQSMLRRAAHPGRGRTDDTRELESTLSDWDALVAVFNHTDSDITALLNTVQEEA